MIHFIRRRPRLIIALTVGIGVGLTLPSHWRLTSRFIIAWDAGIWLYLVLIAWVMANAHHLHVRQVALQEHRSRLAELTLLLLAAFASLAVITVELTKVKSLAPGQQLLHYLFTGITVFGSWCLIIVLFSLHYAHLFYKAHCEPPPLEFSDNSSNPDYWDFLYFASTIAVAAQTSDVLVKSKAMRKTVMAQSIISFIFNVAIVGLSINIVAGLLDN